MTACHCKTSSGEAEDPIDAKGKRHEGHGQRAVRGRPYHPRLKARRNRLSQEIEDPSPAPDSAPVTPSPEPRPIPAPCFRHTASSSEHSLEAFTEHLIMASAPEAFFDDRWDEKVSQVLVEEEEVDKAESPDLGGPDKKVSKNVAGPSRLQ